MASFNSKSNFNIFVFSWKWQNLIGPFLSKIAQHYPMITVCCRLVVTLSVPTPSRPMIAWWWLETAAPWRNWTRLPAACPGHPPWHKISIGPWKQLHFSHTVHWTYIFSSSLDSRTWHVIHWVKHYQKHSTNKQVLFKKSLEIRAYKQHLTTSNWIIKFLKKRENLKNTNQL